MFAALAVIVPIVDQLVKSLVIEKLPVYESVTVIPGLLAWTHVRNPGAAFGLFPFQRPLFIFVAGLMVVLAIVFRKRILAEPKLVQVALGLGLGGAIGNLIDRLRTGYVTDFIEVPFIPIFNIADMSIVFGVGLLIWFSFFHKEQPELKTPSEPAPTPTPVGEGSTEPDA